MRIPFDPHGLIGLGLIALMVSCAATDPGLRTTSPPHVASPADVDRADLTFTARDGLTLYAQRWRPRTGDPRATVVIHHGLADHSDRYAGFAERLVHAGYAVWALDMRGHGRSAGPRVQIDRIDDLLDDLDRFVALVREREPGRPIVLYGHSLGGLTTALYAIERKPGVAGVVLAAPGIAADGPAIQVAGIRLVAALAPNAKILPLPHAGFSSNPTIVAEMDRDPLIAQTDGPARLARAAIDGIARVWAHPETLVVPLLIVHGKDDTVTAPSGSRDLVARAGTTDRTLALYDGLHHDVLHDPGGDRVAADIIAWLDKHTGATPTGDAPAPFPARSPDARLTAAATPLPGDRAPRTMAVELDVRGEHRDGDSGATAGLRLRFGTGATAGYTGGIDLRGGYLSGARYEADAHLLGFAVRSGATTLSLTAGVGIGGLRGASATHLPVELALEAPLGPTRLVARAGLGRRLGGADYADDAFGIADEATALAGIRLGRDRGYWSTVRAGAGPFVAVSYRNLGGADVWGVALGGELWGGN
ncbi:MAG TPA: alpha/beta hydrolase [Kofleriaceae bacterium]|jgi:alpha-beta hydrolase superfamily lysophospholipase|nr:alpha/beta hydrolase [Kofleriaceae bacterium]